MAVYRSRFRLWLDSLGLLDAARYARNAYRTLRFIRPNSRYWGKGAPDGQPIPPFQLRILVSGSPDIDWFLASGARGAEHIRGVLQRNGLDLKTVAPILDFGCGCGRVTRHWSREGIEVHGSDLNPQLIAWCRDHLTFGSFAVNGLAPPLDYRGEQFGFVYALSVFTHLPDELQHAWMAEMRRVIRPGGYLLFTTHGEHYIGELTPEEQRAFHAGRLAVRRDDTPGSNFCGAYHPESYVRDRLAKGFSIIEFVPKGALGNPYQDSWLLRRQ